MLDVLLRQPLSDRPLKLTDCEFFPVMDLPDFLPVFDFTRVYDPDRMLESPYGVGRYDEIRPTMYTEAHFTDDIRNIHMGIDLAGPIGTSVHAFMDGKILRLALIPCRRTMDHIITAHQLEDETLYALYGHLSLRSLEKFNVGESIRRGDILGELGGPDENGGWNPHLHFQLSRVQPVTHDLPGVVSAQHREWARQAFPDPRLVLGPIY